MKSRLLRVLLILAVIVQLALLWFSTAVTQPYQGEPSAHQAGRQNDDLQRAAASGRSGKLAVLLGFSGGGTRAAALSYGVLQELADTTIGTSAGNRQLLDEVDMISSVSGGSFTSAYFGLFGDRIFEDYREAMLLRPIQSDLAKALLAPKNWHDLSSPYFGRSDMAADYYDEHLFEGKTFADIDLSTSPWIMINASDIATGDRLVFNRHIFDVLCIDYDAYPISRAVAASSGVPGATTPITIKNRAGSCGYQLPEKLRKSIQELENPVALARLKSYAEYLSSEKRPWLHLVDGGITDNLGLRLYYMFTTLSPEIDSFFTEYNGAVPDEVLIISVNAAVEHRLKWAARQNSPTTAQSLGAMTHIQMNNYTADTKALVLDAYRRWGKSGRAGSKQVSFEFVEVAFANVSDASELAYLNELPTSLQLSAAQVDKVIATGRRVLRESPGFQRFLARNRPVSHEHRQ